MTNELLNLPWQMSAYMHVSTCIGSSENVSLVLQHILDLPCTQESIIALVPSQTLLVKWIDRSSEYSEGGRETGIDSHDIAA